MYGATIMIPRAITARDVETVLETFKPYSRRNQAKSQSGFVEWAVNGASRAFFVSLGTSDNSGSHWEDQDFRLLLNFFNSNHLSPIVVESGNFSDPKLRLFVYTIATTFGGMIDEGDQLLYRIVHGEAVDIEGYLKYYLP